jgi:hypothetical protein
VANITPLATTAETESAARTMQSDEFIVTPVGDGLIIARQHGQRLYALNETARLLWTWRAAGMTETRMAEELVATFGIEPAIAARDIAATLRQWRDESLIGAHHPSISCVVGGCHVLVQMGPANVREAILPLLSNFIVDEAGRPGGRPASIEVTEREGKYLVSTGSETSTLTATVDGALEAVLIGLLQHVFNATDWQFSMHSAAVGRGEGCILIAGESGRGKSTLLAHMLAEGFDYVADDLVLIVPPELAVVPIPMPLIFKRGSWEALAAVLPGLDTARVFRRAGRDVKYWNPERACIAAAPRRIRAIIFPRYVKDAPFNATQLSAFHAIERITKAPMRIGIPLAHQAVERLVALIEHCPVYELSYGDAGATSRWAGELLAG